MAAQKSGARRSPYPPQRAAGRGNAWYRGDCHTHSTCSNGGELTPEQLAAEARAAGLDFIAITEHNSCETHAAWGRLAGDDLLVILGQEVTTRTGHWLALGIDPEQTIDWRYGVDDEVIGQQLDRVHRVGGLCVAAHPHAPYPTGEFAYPFQGFDLVEVWNGRWSSDLPWNADNEAALADWGRALADWSRAAGSDAHPGSWRPAIGNSDVHLAGQLAVPHTVVPARELSTDAILAGLKAGRSWIAGSAEVALSYTITAGGRGAGIGERLATGGQPAVVRVDVRGVPAGTVSLHTDRGEVHRERLPDDGTGRVRWTTDAAESAFVRVETRHPDGQMAALSNPIILS